MSKDLLGQRKIKRHKEDRPVYSVESEDILTDNMNVTGPVFLEMLRLLLIGLVGIVTESCDIVGKRVKPNVNHVLIVKSNGDSPFERGSGNAEILKSRLEEVVDHLLFAGFGLNELGVVLDMLHQSVNVLCHLEEISLFLSLLNGSAAVGTLAVHRLRLCEEGLTGSTVPALIMSLVDISAIVKLLEYLCYRGLVIIVGGTDKVIVGRIHPVPDALYLGSHAVNVSLGSYSRLVSEIFYLLTVLVSSRAEEDVVAHLSFVTRYSVGHNYLVGITEVGLSRCIRDSRGYIKLILHFDYLFFLYF